MTTALKILEERFQNRGPKHKRSFAPVGEVYRSLIEHFPLKPIENEEEHELALYIVSELIELSNDEVFKESDQKQVDHYLKPLGILVREYERIKFPQPKVSGREMLKFMMELHGLKQSDLAKELGGQPIVSAILRGNRELNKKQIEKLAHRFQVPVEIFFG